MTLRLRLWLLTCLIALDQLAHVLLAGPKYILAGGPRPNPDETISSKVGRQAMRGKRWALVAEWMVDGLFRLLTGECGHCRAKIERSEIDPGLQAFRRFFRLQLFTLWATTEK